MLWLKDIYLGSGVNVKIGAELPAIDDAAYIDFLLLVVTYVIVWLIFTEHPTFGVGNDGNYIRNCVVVATAEVIVISKVLSVTVAEAENNIDPETLNKKLMGWLLKLSN